MSKGFSVLGLGLFLLFPAFGFAAVARYSCGSLPETLNKVVLTLKADKMRVQLITPDGTAVIDNWYFVTKSPNTISTEIGVGTGTTYMMNLQLHPNQTVLFVAETYYGEETTITPLGSQICSPL